MRALVMMVLLASVVVHHQHRADRGRTGGGTPGSRVLLTTLSVRTSAEGNAYLAGRLGKASVVVFPGEADKFGHPTLDLFLYRRGLAGRVVETIVSLRRIAAPGTGGPAFEWTEMEEARQAAVLAEFGPWAWIARVEDAAGGVLTDAGYRVERDRLGLVIVPDGRPLPDANALDPLSLAARVVNHARGARVVLTGENVAAFECGAQLAQAAQELKLELAGWPLAAERGRKSKVGEDKSLDPALRDRSRRWCGEVERATANGAEVTAAMKEIAVREGVPWRTVQSAVNREKKRRQSQ